RNPAQSQVFAPERSGRREKFEGKGVQDPLPWLSAGTGPERLSYRTPKFSSGAGGETECREKALCRARLLQRLDTYDGIAWDGPGPVPRVYGLEAAKLLPKRGIFRKGVAFQPRCGLRLPDPSKGDHDALLQPTAPILLRRRFARQDHVPVHPRPGRRRRLA